MAAIDLYSGIGGWSLGFKMAGIPVISSYEWWKDANNTHNKNFGSSHKEINIRELALTNLPNKAKIKFVVGSPPCTQFSLSNRGGKGDIADGLIDIQKFLEVVEYVEPKYWAMENVPRVANILEKELSKNGKLNRFKHLFGDIRVYNSSDFGVPQDRKRMIAGKFPFDLFDSYSQRTSKMTLGDVLKALEGDPVIDPIYNIQLERKYVTDHVFEPNLSREEERINRESKTHHPVYNIMSFPDKQDRPSRTITALCTRVSRESIIIKDSHGNLRRLTVRERGCLQSFPINFQYFSNSYAGKIKMIGNAIPPLLTFYIAQSMNEIEVGKLVLPKKIKNNLNSKNNLAISHQPDNEGTTYQWNRSFWLAITGLRFGSGVRFELKNYHDKGDKTTTWRINFFYGNSKAIKEKALTAELFERAIQAVDLMSDRKFLQIFDELKAFIEQIKEQDLQLNWTNQDRGKMSPLLVIDTLAQYVNRFKAYFQDQKSLYWTDINLFVNDEFQNEEGKLESKKLLEFCNEIFIGILIGSWFNSYLEGKKIKMKSLKLSA
jgi:DNA (cytosine-5)-methyltransferase 1